MRQGFYEIKQPIVITRDKANPSHNRNINPPGTKQQTFRERKLKRAKCSLRNRKRVSERTLLNKYVNRPRTIKEALKVRRPSGSNESIQVPATQGDDHGCQSKAEKEMANRNQSPRTAAGTPCRRSTAPQRAENGLPFLGLQRHRYCCLIGISALTKNTSILMI